MRRMYSKAQIEKIAEEHGGKVKSVNEKTGDVVLNATDIKLTTTGTTVQDNFIRIDTNMDGKLDKVTTTGGLRAYIIAADGGQSTLDIGYGANAGTLARRETGGALQVGTPTADNHAATKKYVDDSLTFFRHNVHLSDATNTFNAYFSLTKKSNAAVSFTELTVDTLVGTSSSNLFSATGVGNVGPIIGLYLTDYQGQTAIKIVGLTTEAYLTMSDARINDIVTEI